MKTHFSFFGLLIHCFYLELLYCQEACAQLSFVKFSIPDDVIDVCCCLYSMICIWMPCSYFLCRMSLHLLNKLHWAKMFHCLYDRKCNMWVVSRMEIEKMFPDSGWYKSAEREISVDMGTMTCSPFMKFTFITSGRRHRRFAWLLESRCSLCGLEQLCLWTKDQCDFC